MHPDHDAGPRESVFSRASTSRHTTTSRSPQHLRPPADVVRAPEQQTETDTPLAPPAAESVGAETYGASMGAARGVANPNRCAWCDAAMPPRKGSGRPRVYCRPACRKAAYEARRARKPGAFEVKIVQTRVVERYDIRECVEQVKTSPVACRNVLLHLIELLDADELHRDPKWERVITTAYSLGIGLIARAEEASRDRPSARRPD